MFESLRGQILIAKGHLKDPNFFKAAVLLVEHSRDGAMGLVVNRPSSITVSNALLGHFEVPTSEDLVFVGGPVEPAALFILHDSPAAEDETSPVIPGLFIGSSADAFEKVIHASIDEPESVRFRIFSGCAGWGPRQLEGELRRNDWFIVPGDDDIIFKDDPYGIWESLMQRAFELNRLLPHNTEHPEWN